MDLTFKDYFDKLSNSLDGIHADIRSNTTTIQTTAAKLDDLVQWRPDLERRVDLLTTAVAELQQGRSASEEEQPPMAKTAPPPAPLRDHVGTSKDAEGGTLGYVDRGIDVLPRGLAPAFASVSTPANGQFALHSPVPLASPYAHASQLLAGIG